MCSAVRTALLAAFAICLIPVGTAHAKFSFSPQYGTVVSISEQGTSADSTKDRKAPKQQIVKTAPSVQSSDNANTALDRIEIPQDVVERISELLTPGSSLIISDYGISSETGPYTDFIVLTH